MLWTGQGKKKFLLSRFLACPVSTGRAERVFSIAGKAMSANRVNLRSCNLEAEGMQTMNQVLVSKLFEHDEMIDEGDSVWRDRDWRENIEENVYGTWQLQYRKVPKISTGAYFLTRNFWRAYFRGVLTFGAVLLSGTSDSKFFSWSLSKAILSFYFSV